MSTDVRILGDDDPLAVQVTAILRAGDEPGLRALLLAHPDLATARIVTTRCASAGGRSLLHVLTDWPGGAPNAPALVSALVAAGADVNAPFVGRHAETALHWAASSDNVAVVDRLLDLGADLEAGSGVIGGGTALADAVAFGQWNAARRLLARGAKPNLWQAAALGLADRVQAELDRSPAPQELTNALWCACHGGQRATAELLLAAGADPTWVGHDQLTPLEAARRSGATAVVEWLAARLPST